MGNYKCEIHQYLFDFNHLVSNNTNQGKHHREYYLTITATNNANLHSRQMIDIIIDESPPTVGVILEGLSDDDQAEMDFTSSDVVHVRWHGFLDHESGILLYRVALADRCLTDEEMDAADNATEVKQGEMTSFKFPSEDGITYDTTPPLLVNVSITHARTREEVACTQPDQPWLVNSNMTRVRLARTSDCLNFCSSNSTNEDVSHLPISSNHTLVDEISDHFCRTLPKMTEDSYIALPSDYLKLTWAAVDAESEMEEYHVGMGRDRTTASAPDLLPFTPTNGHHSYHARHSGLGHGAVFFIFLRALSKAGLHVQLTLGPVMTDVTPPEVRQPLTAAVDEDFLSVSWNESAFVDPEQPVGLDFDVAFRIGYDSVFITPFLTVPASSLATCQKSNVTGCARYPISALYAHDTESGRSFFFQLHVTNVAGHVTSVNTSAVRLPAHFAPSHAVIIDVIKPQAFDNGGNGTTTLSDNFDGILDDVDVILQREEVCVAWNGLYHEDEVDVEVGIGTNTTQDDLVIQRVNHTGAGQGSLYVCLQPVFPWRADNPTCHRLVRPGNINHVDPFHVIELPHTTLRQTDFGDYLHSHQLGSKLHELLVIKGTNTLLPRPMFVETDHKTYSSDVGVYRVYWAGFSDPHSGLDYYRTYLSRGTVKAGLTLPLATPLYVTVRARNPAGLDTVSVSDSFKVDPSPPEIVIIPHFLSPRDGSAADSQWDRSILRLAWRFVDPDSSVVSHSIDIRSEQTGRLVTDTIRLGADTEPGAVGYVTVEDLKMPIYFKYAQSGVATAEHVFMASVHAENHAGQWSRFISRPVIMDRTPPELEDVKVSLRYVAKGQDEDDEASVASLSNIALLSPFDRSDHGVRSSNSSLEFCWHGVQDPAVTEVQYRFLHESRPLSVRAYVFEGTSGSNSG
nr:hypothetical protein BaRGS_032815 [Batillaria attramentaria]